MARRLCLSFLLICATATAASEQGKSGENIEQGRRLHDQHCLRCHGPQMYQRPESAIEDLATLRQRVNHCELGQELSWFPDEVDKVVAYLNARYYHFSADEGAGKEQRPGVQTLDLPGAMPAPGK